METPIHKDRWYIDIRGQVSGPQTSWSIICNLIEGHLKVIHRVSRDNRHWKAICNEVYFEKAIRELIQHLSAEAVQYAPEQADKNEASGFHNLQNVSQGINEQLEHANKLQEINLSITNLRQLLAEIMSKRKIVVTQSQATVDEVHPDDADEFHGGSQSYFRWPTKKKMFKTLSALGFIGLIYFGVTQFLEIQRQKEAELAAAKVEEALKAKTMGNYEKAIQSFHEIKNPESLDSNTLMEMAEAHIQTRQIEQGRALAKIALKQSTASSQRARAQSILGALAVEENNLDLAADYYEKSVKEQEGFFSTMFNLSIVYLEQNDPVRAEELLLKAIQIAEDHEKAPALLALFEAAWALDLKPAAATSTTLAPTGLPAPAEMKFQRLSKVKELIAQIEQKSPSYTEEFLIAKIVIASVIGDQSQFHTLTENLIALDPQQIPPKKYYLNIDYQRAQWSHIYNWCFKIYNEDRGNDYKNAFFASCAQKSKSAKEALPYAQYAYKLNPNSPVIKNLLENLNKSVTPNVPATATNANPNSTNSNRQPSSTK